MSWILARYALIGICYALQQPQVPQNHNAAIVRLMSFNIHAWRDSDHIDNFNRIVDCVRNVQPDILCLNEVLHPFCKPPNYDEDNNNDDDNNDDNYSRQIQNNQRDVSIPESFLPSNNNEEETFLYRLADATGLPNIEYVAATTESFFGKGSAFGNAILTKHEIQNVNHRVLTPDPDDVHLGDQKRDFVEPRAFSSVIITSSTSTTATTSTDTTTNSDNGNSNTNGNNAWTMGVGVTHLDHKSEELREKQILRGIRESANPCFSSAKDSNDDNATNTRLLPHIICGDWNTFQKSDYDEAGWNAILSLYKSRGWPDPPEESLVLNAVQEEGYVDTFYEQRTTSPNKSNGNKNDTKTSIVSKYPDPTAWTVNPLMRIDHIFLKQQDGNKGGNYDNDDNSQQALSPCSIVIRDHFRVETDASDHFPIVVDMELGATTSK